MNHYEIFGRIRRPKSIKAGIFIDFCRDLVFDPHRDDV